MKEPRLDLDRVKEIYEEVSIPLVMHGGSGIAAEDYQTAIANGIAKINYYTYANQAGAAALKDYLKEESQEYFLEDCLNVTTKALKEDYVRAIKIFSGK